MDDRDYKAINKELNKSNDNNCQIINGCIDCPFNYEYEMSDGYGCKLDTEKRRITQSKKYLPITPNWCPIKKNNIVFKYK